MTRPLLIAALLSACAPSERGRQGSPSDDVDPPDTTPKVATCADAGLRERTAFVQIQDTGALRFARSGNTAWGLGLADFDGDGWLDLVQPHQTGISVYGGAPDFQFVDRTEAWLPELPASRCRAVAVADVDADDDLDLFVTCMETRDRLLFWTGDGFEDRSATSGLKVGAKNHNAAFADMDADGDVDLVVGSGPDPGNGGLYENLGDGTFVDVSDRLPADAFGGLTWALAFVDLEGDGLPDLYAVNDGSMSNRVFFNRPTGWVEDTENASGLVLEGSGMGVAIADLNLDRVPDLLWSDWEQYRMHESTPIDGLWSDSATARQIQTRPDALQILPWGVAFEDLDNDGDLDLLASHSPAAHDSVTYTRTLWQRQALFEQEDGVFWERSTEWGLEFYGAARGFAMPDLDGDGWLDVVIKDTNGPPVVYRALCGEASWLTVDLHDPDTANRDGIGAWIEIEVDGDRQRRPIVSGNYAFSSHQPTVAHFGLGEHEVVDTLTVEWPDGRTTTLRDVEGRQMLTVSP